MNPCPHFAIYLILRVYLLKIFLKLKTRAFNLKKQHVYKFSYQLYILLKKTHMDNIESNPEWIGQIKFNRPDIISGKSYCLSSCKRLFTTTSKPESWSNCHYSRSYNCEYSRKVCTYSLYSRLTSQSNTTLDTHQIFIKIRRNLTPPWNYYNI